MRREYIPLSIDKLQLMIDLDRLDTSKPIDLVQLCNSGFFDLKPDTRQYGFALTDDGIEKFKGKINIEVQHASELIISTIERNGGVIRTAYFDVQALMAMRNPKKFFATGVPIPRYVCLVYLFKYNFFWFNSINSNAFCFEKFIRRLVPPQDAIDYYTDPKNRGYLADPEAISHERLVSLLNECFFNEQK